VQPLCSSDGSSIAIPSFRCLCVASRPKLSRTSARARRSSPGFPASREPAFAQSVFNADSFESARSGFADYARDGENARELRARVNRTILEDLEQKVLALRALRLKLRDIDAGENFGGVVARARPTERIQLPSSDG